MRKRCIIILIVSLGIFIDVFTICCFKNREKISPKSESKEIISIGENKVINDDNVVIEYEEENSQEINEIQEIEYFSYEPEMIPIQPYDGEFEKVEEAEEIEEVVMPEKLVQVIGNVKDSKVEILENLVWQNDEDILKAFVSNGWNVYITDENIAKVYFNGKYKSVIALTRYSKKQIIFEDRSESELKEAVFHEFGHFFDYLNCFPSQTVEFDEIYNEEVNDFKNNISNSECVFDKMEFFAEVYNYFITDPVKCTPRALEYIYRLKYL